MSAMFMCTLDKEKLTKNQDKEERKFSWFSVKKNNEQISQGM